MTVKAHKHSKPGETTKASMNPRGLIFNVTRFFMRLAGRFFLSRVFPVTARKRILRFLERSALARALVLRLPPRVYLEHGVFLTDVGSPSVASRLGFWTGAHEAPERRLVKYLAPKVGILEIGAGIGVVSWAAWRAAKCPRMVVVDANPLVLEVLRANLRENNVPATIVHSALAYDGDLAELLVKDDWIYGSVGGGTEDSKVSGLRVPAITLERLLDDHFDAGEQVQLILDIEGGEWELVARERDVIRNRVSRVVVELHGDEDAASLIEKGRRAFGALGFRELSFEANVAIYTNNGCD